MEFNIGRIIMLLTLLLIFWLLFELIEFFRLGGAGQPLAWCIVKISVITSTIIDYLQTGFISMHLTLII